MKTPIVLAAFGTTSRAMKTYRHMNTIINERFPDHDVRWAYSSRMVRDQLRKKRQNDIQHPQQVLEALHREGHSWAVVQSLHIICGHEFYRLVEDARLAPIRTSIGLPLLAAQEDFKRVANALKLKNGNHPDEAVVLVGHGTDHPGWTTYPAFENHLRKICGPHVYIGVVEGHPSQEEVLQDILRSGIRNVCIMPFMLVAGVHFEEDMAGEEDSWKSTFETAGLDVRVLQNGVGSNETIVGLFTDHIQAALDVIPSTVRAA